LVPSLLFVAGAVFRDTLCLVGTALRPSVKRLVTRYGTRRPRHIPIVVRSADS